MSSKAIIGLGFGDEGKGVATEYLCSKDPENTIVIRFSGGQQAAHTVIRDDIEHIFHNFGSGTLIGCPTYWSRYCTFEPYHFMIEYQSLVDKGINPKIYIHPDCPVTTFYDMYPKPGSKEMKHGTTGHGIFRTKQRHFKHGLSITIEDLYRKSPETIMETVRSFYNVDRLSNIEHFIDAVEAVKSTVIATDYIPNYKHKVFEGSQGLMLDEHIGYMPHCSPSDITPKPILEMEEELDEILLITRCYQTRHGNGPMSNENHPVTLINNKDETCTYNRYQGRFRTSILDIDQLIHAKAIGIDQVVPGMKTNLLVTCMDQMNNYSASINESIANFVSGKVFIEYLGQKLNITGELLFNTSPHSKTIERLGK